MSLVPVSSSSKSEKVKISKRPIGDDGHFFQCVISDTEGLLLCCDNCPATYHLNCLSPPLEKVPEGDWQCPNCSNQESEDSPDEPADPNPTSPAINVNEVEDLRENTRVSNNNVSLIEPENAESGERKIKVYTRRQRKKAAEESGKGTQGSENVHDKLVTLREVMEQSVEACNAIMQNVGDKEANPLLEAALQHTQTGKDQKENFAQLPVTQNSGPSFKLDRTFGGAWSEEELDNLWREEQRHGRHEWEEMLGDPLLRFSDHRAVEDSAERWRKGRPNLMNCQDTLAHSVTHVFSIWGFGNCSIVSECCCCGLKTGGSCRKLSRRSYTKAS